MPAQETLTQEEYIILALIRFPGKPFILEEDVAPGYPHVFPRLFGRW